MSCGVDVATDTMTASCRRRRRCRATAIRWAQLHSNRLLSSLHIQMQFARPLPHTLVLESLVPETLEPAPVDVVLGALVGTSELQTGFSPRPAMRGLHDAAEGERCKHHSMGSSGFATAGPRSG